MASMVRLKGLALGLAVLAALACPRPAPAQAKKANFRRVNFKTYDGVELEGTFYPAGGVSKDTTVLFLHDFDPRAGGSSHQDGWDALAKRLQDEGYSVLSFDFRGFGGSKTIDKNVFKQGRFPHNAFVRVNRTGDAIDQKDFQPSYYKFLVNDIAAAKAYLDRQNDARAVNSSNLIVIGAGQGATLGAMWLASECRRCRVRLGPGIVPVPMGFDDPESKDVAAAVWLTISPKLAGASALHGWTRTAAKEKKIRTAFVYGKEDAAGDNVAKGCIKAAASKDDSAADAFTIPDTKNTGSKLLAQTLDTEDRIVKALNYVTEKRGARVWTERKVRDSLYEFVMPGGGNRHAKTAYDEVPFVDVQLFYGR